MYTRFPILSPRVILFVPKPLSVLLTNFINFQQRYVQFFIFFFFTAISSLVVLRCKFHFSTKRILIQFHYQLPWSLWCWCQVFFIVRHLIKYHPTLHYKAQIFFNDAVNLSIDTLVSKNYNFLSSAFSDKKLFLPVMSLTKLTFVQLDRANNPLCDVRNVLDTFFFGNERCGHENGKINRSWPWNQILTARIVSFLSEKTLKNLVDKLDLWFSQAWVATVFHTWTLVSFREYERLKCRTPTPPPSDNYT